MTKTRLMSRRWKWRRTIDHSDPTMRDWTDLRWKKAIAKDKDFNFILSYVNLQSAGEDILSRFNDALPADHKTRDYWVVVYIAADVETDYWAMDEFTEKQLRRALLAKARLVGAEELAIERIKENDL
jgi:hypothetical protein